MLRSRSPLAAVFLCALAFFCCVGAAAASPEAKTITITYVKHPLNAPLVIAKVLGLYEKAFEPEGFTVRWTDLLTGAAQAQALSEGSVQFASVIGWDAVLSARAKGDPVRAIAVFARAPRSFCIMSKNPSIKTVADLKGRTVAGPKGAQLYLLLLMALERAGLTASDVTFVDMQLQPALTTLLSGGVDAAVLAGAGKTRAQSQGARAVACGDGLTIGLMFTAVNEDFLRANPDLARRYVSVHAQALAFLKANPERARAILAKETGLSPADVERLLPEYDFSPEVTGPDKRYLAEAQDFLLRHGLIPRPADLDGLFWP
ncbi:ABC transporter substrate-binding protein [Fundidesulfovibrio terrae]|uniref:ABC transporter substrate-binding protein n=1 Tax=Fundidesulfovibrio terrae TaxID=2922866 RepID=UPI001FAF8376|nr:ABC transporter substrate-binding protein [Fundidesulfovibrio terrae]